VPAARDTTTRWWPASLPHTSGRLGDFRLAGRLGPLVAFAVVAAAIFWAGGSPRAVTLVKLWTAYAVAFFLLAALARRCGANPPWSYVLPVAVLGVALGGFASAAIVFAPNWRLLATPAALWPEWAIGAGFAAFFVGLSFVTAEVRRREQLIADAKRQLLEARLQTLTAQIEPHFLMNTLANLRYLIGANPRAASEMLDHLADFLERALDRSRAAHSTLGEELQLVASYLAIMQIRMGERLAFELDAPAELKSTPFPPLLLHTLVENAVVHGIEPKEGNGLVTVSARRDGERIVIRIVDDGVGLDGSAEGFGLRNTRERLATFYDGRASLELEPAAPRGVTAAIMIPLPA
jgi:signal transduction histidine kinase